MNNRHLLFASSLALPAVAVIFWMLTASPRPDSESDPEQSVSEEGSLTTVPGAASAPSRTAVKASAASADIPGITRRSEDAFPELTTAPAPAPAFPVSPVPSISPRYTLTTQPDAATLARRLEAQPPLDRDERIRVLPAEVTDAASTETHTSDPAKPAMASSALLLRLDSTLQDPAAWFESDKPLGEKQQAVKEKIAADFTAEIAAAAKQPETAGKTFDETWKDARDRSNWAYRKIFGADAANRAALEAWKAARAQSQ